METQKVADRLMELYNAGTSTQAEEELYADDVKSFEQNPAHNAAGKAAIIAKTKAAVGYFEETYKNMATKIAVNNDSFLVVYEIDAKPRGGERMQMTEYGFYKLRDGKVSEEYFFVIR